MALTRRDLGRRAFAGAAAFGSHRELVEAHDDEKAWSVEFGVLQIWQK